MSFPKAHWISLRDSISTRGLWCVQIRVSISSLPAEESQSSWWPQQWKPEQFPSCEGSRGTSCSFSVLIVHVLTWELFYNSALPPFLLGSVSYNQDMMISLKGEWVHLSGHHLSLTVSKHEITMNSIEKHIDQRLKGPESMFGMQETQAQCLAQYFHGLLSTTKRIHWSGLRINSLQGLSPK